MIVISRTLSFFMSLLKCLLEHSSYLILISTILFHVCFKAINYFLLICCLFTCMSFISETIPKKEGK